MRKVLVYIGGLLTIIWGIAHLFPTHDVVKGFGNISHDNAEIVKMEWINEGLLLIFLGCLTIVATIINNDPNKTQRAVYFLSFIMLVAMTVLSLFTGFKIDFLPFRLCPVIFMISGLLILQAAFIRKDQE